MSGSLSNAGDYAESLCKRAIEVVEKTGDVDAALSVGELVGFVRSKLFIFIEYLKTEREELDSFYAAFGQQPCSTKE